jgi:hypothetical protein
MDTPARRCAEKLRHDTATTKFGGYGASEGHPALKRDKKRAEDGQKETPDQSDRGPRFRDHNVM